MELIIASGAESNFLTLHVVGITLKSGFERCALSKAMGVKARLTCDALTLPHHKVSLKWAGVDLGRSQSRGLVCVRARFAGEVTPGVTAGGDLLVKQCFTFSGVVYLGPCVSASCPGGHTSH